MEHLGKVVAFASKFVSVVIIVHILDFKITNDKIPFQTEQLKLSIDYKGKRNNRVGINVIASAKCKYNAHNTVYEHSYMKIWLKD